MPVAPFGRPIDISAWDRFRGRTGIAVVVDAAAAVRLAEARAGAVVVSLHATKVLGLGEGGCIASRDDELIRDLRARCNFGFSKSRDLRVTATNAKLSEYHAAVGLAALAEWDVARQEWLSVAAEYRRALQRSNRVRLQEGFGTEWIAATCVVMVADAGADRVEQALSAEKIETRRWWGRGAHDHPATRNMPRSSLLVTESFGAVDDRIAVLSRSRTSCDRSHRRVPARRGVERGTTLSARAAELVERPPVTVKLPCHLGDLRLHQ